MRFPPAFLVTPSLFFLHFLDYLSNKPELGVGGATINTEKGQNSQESPRIRGKNLMKGRSKVVFNEYGEKDARGQKSNSQS